MLIGTEGFAWKSQVSVIVTVAPESPSGSPTPRISPMIGPGLKVEM
jgi:hypothetical protein